MGAVARKKQDERRFTFPQFSKLSIRNLLRLRYLLFVVVGIILSTIAYIISQPPSEITFRYAGVKGCIQEDRLKSDYLKKPIVLSSLSGSNEINRNYTCTDKVWVHYKPFRTLEIEILNKEVVLGAVVYQPDVSDETKWKDMFNAPKGSGELQFYANDGSVVSAASGFAVPRINYLQTTVNDRLSQNNIAALLRLHKILQEMDDSAPVVDYSSLGVARISTVTFIEAYLDLDNDWETQLRKMLAVKKYYEVRGNKAYVFDARLRDVVVTPI